MIVQLFDSNIKTWPFYLRSEYFISPSVSPLGLPVYTESLASAYAQAIFDESPLTTSSPRSYDRRVLSSLTSMHLKVIESILHFFIHHSSSYSLVAIWSSYE